MVNMDITAKNNEDEVVPRPPAPVERLHLEQPTVARRIWIGYRFMVFSAGLLLAKGVPGEQNSKSSSQVAVFLFSSFLMWLLGLSVLLLRLAFPSRPPMVMLAEDTATGVACVLASILCRAWISGHS